MKQIFTILALAVLPLAGIAQNCEIDLSVLPMQQGDDVPENITDHLVTRLTQIATASGIAADAGYNQFFVAGKFNHLYKDVTTTAPPQTVIKTMLTLYIGDAFNTQVFATEALELSGVGFNYDKAYINALSRLNAKNETVKQFLEKGKAKVIDYYDRNISTVIAKADKAAAMQQYDEALYYLTAVPECSNGFKTAKSHLMDIYQKKLDYNGKIFLQRAQSAWNVNPTAKGASDAVVWLNQIDPQSASYPAAVKLGDEMRKTIKADIDFVVREKYHDAIELEKLRIEAARQIGKAYGEGQQQQTTNLLWMR